MRFRFDANQEYQIRAVEAVGDLFEGQLPADPDPPSDGPGAHPPVCNAEARDRRSELCRS